MNIFKQTSNSSITLLLLMLLACSCGRTTYYIARHAEKQAPGPQMSSDVPLSQEGVQRAEKLKTMLQSKNIGFIFSTATIRTTSTAQPLSQATGIQVTLYSHKDSLSRFIDRLKSINKANVLVVGHSNSVDDIVNGLLGKTVLSDLPETVYSQLFVVQRTGKRFRLHTINY